MTQSISFPQAIIFDLDDTLITAYRQPERTWRAIIAEHAQALGEHDARWVTQKVIGRVLHFLSDEEGRRLWRLEGDATRRRVVRSAFHLLNLQRPSGSKPLHGVDADAIADRFETYLEETITLKPGAVEMLQALRQRGIRLGLLTNGAGWRQDAKIDRFGLRDYFQHIQIEDRAGVGKPDFAAYRLMMQGLEVAPHACWMLGDDPLWDVTAPATLGVTAIWYHEGDEPWPEGAAATISKLPQLLPLLERISKAR